MPQHKPYNPNTRYGRRKLREQAWQNYQNASPGERAETDRIQTGCWIILIIIAIIVGIIIYNVSGTEGLKKWLK